MRAQGIYSAGQSITKNTSPAPLGRLNLGTGQFGLVVEIISLHIRIPSYAGDDVFGVHLGPAASGSFPALTENELQGSADATSLAQVNAATTMTLSSIVCADAFYAKEGWFYHPHPDERIRLKDINGKETMGWEVIGMTGTTPVFWSVVFAEYI